MRNRIFTLAIITASYLLIQAVSAWSLDAQARQASPEMLDALRFLAFDRSADALPLLVNAANGADADAAYILATLYAQGKGTLKDEGQAAHWLDEAIKRGNMRAVYSKGLKLAVGKPKGSAEQVIGCSMLRQAADAGLQPPMAFLGSDLRDGMHCGATDQAADELVMKSGYLTDMAYVLMETRRPDEMERGMRLLAQAASEGDSKAMFMLYDRYQKGDGVPRDRVKAYAALVLFQKATGRDVAKNLVTLIDSMSADELLEALKYSRAPVK